MVNWAINYLLEDDDSIQPPDKIVKGQKYWFFKYWPNNIKVDILDYSRIPFLHYFEKKVLKFYIWQALRAFLRTQKYDCIISHNAQSAVLFAFLRTLFGKKLPPHIIIDAGCFNGARDNIVEILPIKFALSSVSGIIYHARVQNNYYRRHFPFLINRTQFVPFGADYDYFSPTSYSVKNYILSFGCLKRDYKTLIDAWRNLDLRDLKLKIVGVDKAANFGIKKIPEGVELIRRVPTGHLRQMMADAKLIVIPLPYYNYSNGQMSLLQSMSMAKPVIVTKTPGVIDYIIDGKNALLVEPYSVKDMQLKLRFLLDNNEFAENLAKEARKIIIRKFNENTMALKILEFVKKILMGC